MKIEATRPLRSFSNHTVSLEYTSSSRDRKVKVGRVLSSPEHVALPTCVLTGTWEKFVAVFYDPLKI